MNETNVKGVKPERFYKVNDKEFGEIKFLNVAQARLAFKHVLDDSAKVVVTRHGEPLKILLGYSEYQKLIRKLKAVQS